MLLDERTDVAPPGGRLAPPKFELPVLYCEGVLTRLEFPLRTRGSCGSAGNWKYSAETSSNVFMSSKDGTAVFGFLALK